MKLTKPSNKTIANIVATLTAVSSFLVSIGVITIEQQELALDLFTRGIAGLIAGALLITVAIIEYRLRRVEVEQNSVNIEQEKPTPVVSINGEEPTPIDGTNLG